MIWVWQTLTSPSSQPRGAVQVERRNFQTRVSKFHGTIWAHLLGSIMLTPSVCRIPLWGRCCYHLLQLGKLSLCQLKPLVPRRGGAGM